MSASLAQIYPSQGLNYYVRDNYYTADKAVGNSEWYGRGAQALGLSGAVDAVKFQRLLDGYDPEGKESLTGLPIKAYGRTEKGKQIRHRAGMDITFSPPKSVSLAAYLGGVGAAETAHKHAVDETLAMLERNHSVVREGERGNRKKAVTGNLIVAKFLHDTSREKDPQMHTHCIIVSASKRKDGQWRRITTDTFFNNSAFINQYYLNALAKELKNRGIGIVKTGQAFEIEGYSREQIVEFSKRTQKIEKLNAPDKRTERVEKLRARPSKGQEVERQELLPDWQRRSEKLAVVHPGFKSRNPAESDRKIATAQTKTAKHRRQEHVLSERVVEAAQKVAASPGRKTREQIAAEMMRKEPGLFPSAALFERAKNARELISKGNGEIELRKAFASVDDFLRPERPTTIAASVDDIYCKKAQDVSLFPTLKSSEAVGGSNSAARFTGRLAVDFGTTFTPFINDARDAYETVVGKDLISGRKLSSVERLASLGGLVVGSGEVNRRVVKFAIRSFRDVQELLQTNAQTQNEQSSRTYRRADSELEKGIVRTMGPNLGKLNRINTPVESGKESQHNVSLHETQSKIKDDQNLDPESAKWAQALREAQQEQREKREGIQPVKTSAPLNERSVVSGSKATESRAGEGELVRQEAPLKELIGEGLFESKIDPNLDPESAKWAQALREAQQEQREKKEKNVPAKTQTPNENLWKTVQVEGYNKAGFREEQAKEKSKESQKTWIAKKANKKKNCIVL